MDTNNSPAVPAATKHRTAPLTIFLGVIMVFFCAILIFVYVATKRANPVMLDQQGRPVNQPSQPAGGAH